MAEEHERSTPGSISIGGGAGQVVTLGTRRPMRIYGLNDSDFRALSMLNWGATLFFALGSIALQPAISWLMEWNMKKTPGSREIATTFIIVAVVFYVVGIGLAIYNGTLLRKIKRESVSYEESP